jgi:pentatricopeptide repeat protein
MLYSSATAGLRPLLRRRLAAAGAAAAARGAASTGPSPSAALLLTTRRRLSTTTTTSSSGGGGGSGLPPPPAAAAALGVASPEQQRGVMPARPHQQQQPQQAQAQAQVSKREQRRRRQAEAAAATAALNTALASHLEAGDTRGALRALMQAGVVVEGASALPMPAVRPDPRLVHALLLRLCGEGRGEAGPGRAADALLLLHAGGGGKKGGRAGGQHHQQQQRRRRGGAGMIEIGRPPAASAAAGADAGLAIVSFSLVLEQCLRHGLVSKALALFEAAERRGIPLDVPACDQLLACLPSLPPPAGTEEVVAGRIDRVLEHLWGHGLAPTATTYTCAVWAAVRGGDYLKATQLLQVRACDVCVIIVE